MDSRIFAALADPTRRAVFESIVEEAQTVGALAARLPVSRPAVSQHLKVLKEAGLVADEPRGAARVYSIDPQGLGPIRRWLDEQWERSLANFKRIVEQEKDR
jgi:DNA-binding transcriptional ArsR family regulator